MFNSYYNQDNDHDSISNTDMEDDPYMDDNDFRCSSLNLSDNLQTVIPQQQRETKNIPRTFDEFNKPKKTARQPKN